MAFSPDGKSALTASPGEVTLWDIASKRQVYQLHGDWSQYMSVGFPTPDRVIVGSLRNGRTSSLYRAEGALIEGGPAPLEVCASGTLFLSDEGGNRSSIRETDSLREMVSLPFGARGARLSTILSCSVDKRLALVGAPAADGAWQAELWDLISHRRVRTLGAVARSIIFQLSPNGLLAATASGADNMIHLWDTQTGKEVRTFAGFASYLNQVAEKLQPMFGTFKFPPVSAIAFSPDGRLLAASGMDTQVIVWEVQTGAEIERLRAAATTVAISADSRRMLLGNALGEAEIYNIGPRNNGPAAVLCGPHRQPSAFRLTPDAHALLLVPESANAVASGPRLTYLDLQTGRAGSWETEGSQSLNPVSNAAFSPNGKILALGHVNGSVTLWNYATRGLLKKIDPPAPSAKTAAGNEVTGLWTDGATLVVGHRNGLMRMGNSLAGEIKNIELPANLFLDDCIAAPGGKHVLLGFSSDASAMLDSLHNALDSNGAGNGSGAPGDSKGTAVFRMTGPDGKSVLELTSLLGTRGSAAFAPDGHTIWISDGRTVSQYDAASGAKQRSLPDSSMNRSIALSRDGKRLAAATVVGEVTLWDLAGAKIIWRSPRQGGSRVTSLAFLPGDHRILVSQADATSRFVDAATGRVDATLVANYENWLSQTDAVRAVITGGITSPGAALMLSIVVNSMTWVVATPDGRFDSSDFRHQLPLHWVVPDDPFHPLPVELFMRDLYSPGLLPRLLAGEPPPPLPDIAGINRLAPQVALIAVEGEPGIADEIRLTAEVREARDDKTGQRSGAEDLRLFRNGTLVASAPAAGGPLDLSAGIARVIFPHVRFDTRSSQDIFSLYAFNSSGVKSPTEMYIYQGTVPGRPDQHVIVKTASSPSTERRFSRAGRRAILIGVGVGAAAVPALSLRYPANDVERMRRDLDLCFRRNPIDQFSFTPLISDAEHPDGASKEAIRRALADLARNGSHPARMDDTVILFFSGHGYAAPDGKFYLIPSDAGKGAQLSSAVDWQRVLSESVSSEDLSRWLRDIDTGHIVMILDTCQSAASVEGGGFKPGPMGSRGLGQLAYDKGMTILVAAQTNGVAIESNQLQQGILTYALTHDGLEANLADRRPRDGEIKLKEWLRYAVDRVPDLWAALARGQTPDAPGARFVLDRGVTPASLGDPVSQRPVLFDFSPEEYDPTFLYLKTPPPAPKDTAPVRRIAPIGGIIGPIPAMPRQSNPFLKGQPPPGLLREEGDVRSAVDLTSIQPEYTPEARQARIQGTVVIYLHIDEQGQQSNMRVVQSLTPDLDRNALAAIAKWRFAPAVKDGKPIAVEVTRGVWFHIP